jgi:hypothetical protein
MHMEQLGHSLFIPFGYTHDLDLEKLSC